MKILILSVHSTVQAKVIIRPGFSVIKIPEHLPDEQKIELRNKLVKIVDENSNSKFFLKLYYKIGTPYLFLNKRISGSKKVTYNTYKYEEL